MTEFEFVSVLISIIIGLGLTHILAGLVRYVFARRATEGQLVYSLFALVVLVLIFWAISHYLIAITLYPPDEIQFAAFESHRNWFLWSFAGMTLMDIAQTAMRGDLFHPWYYLIFALHYTAISSAATFIRSPAVHRVISWWFLFSVISWSVVVRRFLA